MVGQEEVCNFPLASLSLILSLLWSLGRKKSQELLEAIIHFRAIDFCFTAAADFEALKVLLRSSCQGCHQYLNDYLRGNLKLKDQSLQIRQRQTRFLLLKILCDCHAKFYFPQMSFFYAEKIFSSQFHETKKTCFKGLLAPSSNVASGSFQKAFLKHFSRKLI